MNNVIFSKVYRIPFDASGKPGRPVDIWMDAPVRVAGKAYFTALITSSVTIRPNCPLIPELLAQPPRQILRELPGDAARA